MNTLSIATDKLSCVRKTYYSRIYVSKDNPGFYLKDSYYPEKLIHEHKTLMLLADNGFRNIPEFRLQAAGKRIFLALKNISGDHIRWDKMDGRQINKVADTLKKLHSIKGEKNKPLKYFFAEIIDKILTAGTAYRTISDYNGRKEFRRIYGIIIKCIDNIRSISEKNIGGRLRYSLLHGELTSSHIFLSGKTVKLIDWENSFFGDPAWDLAQLFSEPEFPQYRFLSRYPGYGSDKNTMERIHCCRCLNIIQEIFYLMIDSVSLQYDLKTLERLKGKVYRESILSKMQKIKGLLDVL